MDATALLVIVAIAALIPGTTAWWTGRRVARFLDDPALPELLLARRQRTLQAFAGSVACLIVLGRGQSIWAIPLLGLALVAGNYPVRRTLGLERGGLPRYAWRCARSLVGGLGFWLALLLTPFIVLSIAAPYRLLLLALVPLLLAWEHWGVWLWLWAHDAVPLADADIERRVADIAARAGTSPPPLYRIGGPDTRFVNAVALPSGRPPAIGLGNALLELLEPDEVAAIYAHELSHIEQRSPPALRRTRAVNRGLVLLAVAAGFAAPHFALPWIGLTPALWPLVVVAVLAYRGRRRKQRETESDLRAAALCGDAELVARALVKLHVHALVPRRLPVDLERNATHPSLARRIQALRTAATSAGVAPALDGAVVLPTARPGSFVVFEEDRAHWLDGVPADVPDDVASLKRHAGSTRSVVWDALVELRVAIAGAQRALRATHRDGESWSVPLAPAQVSAVQRALDRVDVRLHRELGRRTFPDVRLIAIAALVTMVWSGDIGVLLVPVALAALWPTTTALAALGTMALGAALLGALRAGWPGGDAVAVYAILAAVGAVAAWRASRRMRARSGHEPALDGGTRVALLALTGLLAVVLLLVGIAAADLPAGRVVQLPLVGTLAIALAGLAAALFTTTARRARASAAVLGAAAVLVAAPALRALAFGARGNFARTSVVARETGRVALPRTTSSVRLSPDGQWFLARHFELAEREEDRFPYTLGSASGARRELRALAADFTGAHELLVLVRAGDSLRLELQDADSSGVRWSQVLPRIARPELVVSPHEGAWVVSGVAEGEGEGEGEGSPVVVSGRIGATSPTVRHLRLADAAGLSMGVVSVGERLIVPAYDFAGRDGPLAALDLLPFRVGLWEVDAAGRRQIGEVDGFPQCGAAEGEYAECLVRQHGRSEIWTLGPRGELSRVGSLPMRELGELARPSLGPGRRITSVRGRRGVVIVDAAAHRITDVDVGADSAYAMAASSVPGRLAVLWRGDAGAAVAFYDVPEVR